jgi:hypothetical protein
MATYAKGLQDGMLKWYKAQAGASDVNVEKRLDREPFDCMNILKQDQKSKSMATALREIKSGKRH